VIRRRRPPIDIFAFLDYRAFLRETYAAKKAEGRGFSFRAFSQRAGLGAPNHLKRVMDGDRNLGADVALRYARALALDADESAYFCDLVTFNQAKTDVERNAALHRLSSSRGYRRANKLELAQATYHANWYLPAIREMALLPDFRADPAWVAARLLPPISAAEAGRALDTLFELGLLQRDPEGRVTQGEALVTTGSEAFGLHVRNYHRAMLERAAEAMQVVPPPERDISSLTFCADDEALRAIKQRIQSFRRELIDWLADRPQCTRVVQLNFQVFPLTRREES
jgi:uncharacterized protein (TIGR02147 family)